MAWKIFDLWVPDRYTLEFLMFNSMEYILVLRANGIVTLQPEEHFNQKQEEEEYCWENEWFKQKDKEIYEVMLENFYGPEHNEEAGE